ncbi:MAG: FMN-binding negative transcriptional regulator [Chitinophagales bacterium]|nr:FMN-binding negative transcriptional regulator [Chitinophagales bacterium]
MGTHLPLELEKNEDGEKFLWGHLSRANPQWKSFKDNDEVMAIFLGPHTYNSSSWYDHVNVPTWNYIAVPMYGKVKIAEGEKLREMLKPGVYEAVSQKPVSVHTMPDAYVQKEMKGIVGFEIAIERIEAKWKLSKNRDAANYQQIISELEKLNNFNAQQIAAEMSKRRDIESIK